MITLATYSYWKSRDDARCSQMRAAYCNGFVTFTGGKMGSHRVAATDAKGVNAHWLGYVENNARKGAVPSRITARKLADAIASAHAGESSRKE